MKKVVLLLFLLVGIGLVDACIINCDCPKAFPYFDFPAVNTSTTSPVPGNQALEILLIPDSLVFMACLDHSWSLMPTAYACSCVQDGAQGPKFPLTQIDITADQAFNDSLPEGASLNHLFLLSSSEEPLLSYTLDQIGQLDYWNYGFYPYGTGLLLQSEAVPDSLGLPFRFTVALTKSNGIEVRTVTREVQW